MEAFCRLALVAWTLAVVCRAQLPEVTLVNTQIGEYFHDESPIQLDCNTQATVTRFQWTKDGSIISASSSYAIMFTSRNSSLRIASFNEALAGRYTCVAETDSGRISSQYVTLRRAFIEASYFSNVFNDPHEVTVQEGIPANISCGTFVSEPALIVSWQRAITAVIQDSIDHSREVVHQDGHLLIVEPSLSQNGHIYQCQGRNGIISARQFGFIRINVVAAAEPAPPLEVTVRPMNQTFKRGDELHFYCIPIGADASRVSITWTTTGTQEFTVVSKFHVAIVNANSSAVVTCTIDNTLQYSAQASIIEPPEFTSALSSQSPTYGQALTLVCAVSSPVEVSWDWYFNGTWLSRESHSVLTRHSVTLEDHGIYQCITRNFAGFRKAAVFVEVNVISASFVNPLPTNLLVYKGQPFTLDCNASGAPPPRYQWTKLSGSPDYTVADGQLIIAEVGVDHAGRYRCQANTVLSDGAVYASAENVTNIQVIDPTVLTSQNRPLYEAQLFTTATFLCSVNHSSAAVVDLTWTKDGQPMLQGGRVELRDGAGRLELMISEVQQTDEGQYQCTVRTTVGELEAPLVTTPITEFRVIDSAVVPEIHLVNATSPNSFELSWSFSGDMNQVSLFRIQVSEAATPTEFILNLERSIDAVTKAEVSSSALQPYTDYTVVVVVVFRNMNIPPIASSPATVKTGIAVPLGPPRDFTAEPKGASTIQLAWKAPTTPRGPIQKYSVRYRSTEPNSSFTMAMVDGTTESYSINNLETYKEYEVQVAAVTSAGLGPYTVPVSAKFVNLPSANSVPFVNSVGFIVLVVVVLLTSIVVGVIAVLLWRRKMRGQKKDRTYSFRHSFKAGVSVGAEEADGPFDQQVMDSYMNRHKRAFSSSSPTSPRSRDIPTGLVGLENESSFGGTQITTSTQVISTTGSMIPRLQSPPRYIDPPGLTSANHLRQSRSPSSYSGKEDYVYMQSVCPSVSPSSMKKDQTMFTFGDGFTNKVPLESSSTSSTTNEGTERDEEDVFEGSHYNHLASQNSSQPPSPNYPNSASPPAYPGTQPAFVIGATTATANGNSKSLAYGRSRSDGKVRRGGGGVPDAGHYIEMKAPGMRQQVSVGQLVDHRLRSQSASDGIGKYDTYV